LSFALYALGVVFLPVEVIYAQSELNRVWRAETERACSTANPDGPQETA
jgi:hypothetical protein